jgi:arginine deiminase
MMEVFTVESRDAPCRSIWISHGTDVCQALQILLQADHLIFYDSADTPTSIADQAQHRHNVLAIDDTHIITYDNGHKHRGIVTAMLRAGVLVGLIPHEGLAIGGGGCHCMTNALRRSAA